ncbi:recombinase RecT [Actinophytocola sediminis]
MTTESITEAANAVAVRDNSPRAMVKQHADSFAAVLPSHVRPDTWVRLAQGALKRGKIIVHPRTRQKCTELELAADNNPGIFLAALLESARLGLEPGTEQFYLTPRKVKGQLEILGIVGYQGFIELMYRAGAISSVVAECVYSGDSFQFRPGVDERPVHDIDWDSDNRGDLRLVYAYAVMKDSATSKVVVLNRSAINTIKASSQGANSEYSPWQRHEAAMWLKSAVRQLAKWVPTSAEYRKALAEHGQAPPQAIEGEAERISGPQPGFAPDLPIDITDTWQAIDEDVLDGEVVDDPPDEP